MTVAPVGVNVAANGYLLSIGSVKLTATAVVAIALAALGLVILAFVYLRSRAALPQTQNGVITPPAPPPSVLIPVKSPPVSPKPEPIPVVSNPEPSALSSVPIKPPVSVLPSPAVPSSTNVQSTTPVSPQRPPTPIITSPPPPATASSPPPQTPTPPPALISSPSPTTPLPPLKISNTDSVVSPIQSSSTPSAAAVSVPQTAAANPHPLKDLELKNIRALIPLLDVSAFKLPFNTPSILTLKNALIHLHPLQFLKGIILSPQLWPHMRNLKQNSLKVYPQWIEDLTEGLEKRVNETPTYLSSFLASVQKHLSPQVSKPIAGNTSALASNYIQQKSGKKLLDLLVDALPHNPSSSRK